MEKKDDEPKEATTSEIKEVAIPDEDVKKDTQEDISEKIEDVVEISEPKEQVKIEELEKSEDLKTESKDPEQKPPSPTLASTSAEEPVEESLLKTDDAEKLEEIAKKTPRGAKTPEPREEKDEKEKSMDVEENLIEVEDPDDYLLYLEQVLRKIHQKFYNIYESTNEVNCFLSISLIPIIKLICFRFLT